jgi:hypothetical protein
MSWTVMIASLPLSVVVSNWRALMSWPNQLRKSFLNVNAYVVKPMDSSEFRAAIKQLGVFWATVNEPPSQSAMRCVQPYAGPPRLLYEPIKPVEFED